MKETRKCESCGRQVNVRYRICPFCAAQLDGEGSFLPPVCPRCRVPLDVYNPQGDEYDLCPECGGLWLDRDEFRRATRPATVQRDDPFPETYRRGPAQDTGSYIPCVRCGKIMNRKNFAKISGVLIDECGMHGVWLDGGELEKIRHFIADGGLERAQDKEIERTRVELRRLATRVDQTAFTQKLLHFWNVKRWLFGG